MDTVSAAEMVPMAAPLMETPKQEGLGEMALMVAMAAAAAADPEASQWAYFNSHPASPTIVRSAAAAAATAVAADNRPPMHPLPIGMATRAAAAQVVRVPMK